MVRKNAAEVAAGTGKNEPEKGEQPAGNGGIVRQNQRQRPQQRGGVCEERHADPISRRYAAGAAGWRARCCAAVRAESARTIER